MSAQPTIRHTLLRSNEFSCPSCVAKIEKQLARVPGVTAAKVHFSTGRIEVDHVPEIAPVETLIAAIGRAGYRANASAF